MAKKHKLPKHIAGVKIPKKLRKRGGEIYAVLDSPVVSHLVAAALLAAADRVSGQPKLKKAGKKAKQAATTSDQEVGSNVIDFASILAMAARQGAKALNKR